MTQALAALETPSLIVHPHALLGDGTEHQYAAFKPGETLGDYMKRTEAKVPSGSVAVWHNGHRVPDDLWERLIPKPGDQVVIRARVLGGGGNKVLQTVAMVALIVVTYGVGGWAGLAPEVAGALNVTIGTAQGLMMAGGMLMIAPLLPEVK